MRPRTVKLDPQSSEIEKLVADVKDTIFKQLGCSNEDIIQVESAGRTTRNDPYLSTKEFKFTLITSPNEWALEDIKYCTYENGTAHLDNEKCSAAKLTCELKNGKTKTYKIS